MDETEYQEVLKLMKDAADKSRGYACYWSWAPDRQIEERGVASTLLRFLTKSRAELVGEIASLPKGEDPPDVILTTENGRRIGIELTELVHPEAIKAYLAAKRLSDEPCYIYTDWTSDLLVEALKERVLAKDKKLAGSKGRFDELILAIYTDELMAETHAAEAISKICVSTDNLDASYLLISYHPETDENKFPDKCAVYSILPQSLQP